MSPNNKLIPERPEQACGGHAEVVHNLGRKFVEAVPLTLHRLV